MVPPGIKEPFGSLILVPPGIKEPFGSLILEPAAVLFLAPSSRGPARALEEAVIARSYITVTWHRILFFSSRVPPQSKNIVCFVFLTSCLPGWPPSPEIRTALAKFTDT